MARTFEPSRLPLALATLLFGCSCAGEPMRADQATEPQPQSRQAPVATNPPRIPLPEEGRDQTSILPSRSLKIGPTRLETWIADREESRRLGLMHVTSMDDDKGMLFVYPNEQHRAFWMKNTFIPLSLAYLRLDGTIDEIVDLEPHQLSSPQSKSAVRFVLEVNQGWFDRHHVKIGTRVEGITDLPGH